METTETKKTFGHGGARPGAGRKAKTEQNDAYSVLAKAKAKRESYKAQMAELEYKQAIAELIPADVVKDRWQDVFANIRAKLIAMPTIIGATCAHCSAEIVEEKARELIYEALEELAKNVRY